MAKLPLKFTILIVVLMITVFVIGTIYGSYSNLPLIVSDQPANDTSIFFELSPQVVSNPVDDVILTWQLDGIEAAYLNDGGVIGNDTRTMSFNICEPSNFYLLEVELLDGQVVEYSHAPIFRLVDPILIILCCIVIIIGVALLATLCSLKWHHYVAIGFVLMFMVLAAMLRTPQCYDDQLFEQVQLTLTPFHSVVYGLTAILSLMIAITALINPQSLLNTSRRIRSQVPFGVMLMIVSAVSAILCLFATAHFNVFPLHFLIIAIVIFAWSIGILSIYTLQPIPVDKSHPFKLEWAQSLHIVIKVVVFVFWLAIYNFDWVRILNNAMLQGIIGFSLFWLAGWVLYAALFKPQTLGVGDMLYGLLIAIFTTMLLSLGGFILGLSISFLLLIYSIISGIALIRLLNRHHVITISLQSPILPFAEIVVSVAFVASLWLGIATHNQNTTEISASDGYTYHAIVTGYVSAERLGFQDFFLGTNYELPMRFWLRFWTASQAMMVKLSDATILQIELVLGVQLLGVSMLAVYYLGRQLGLSHIVSLIASIAHLSLLSAHITSHSEVGTQFYLRLLHDKQFVEFVLAPILVALVTQYLENRTSKHLILLAVGVATISMIHPTATALVALMIGVYVLLSVVINFDHFPALLVIIVLLTAGMLPSVGIRIISPVRFLTEANDSDIVILDNYQNNIDFDEDYNVLGISGNLRTGFAFSLLAVAFVISALYFHKTLVARYILAGCVVILLAMSPYTAPLLAKAISVSHITRTLWLAPFGIALAFLIHISLQFVNRFKLPTIPIQTCLIVGVTVLLPLHMLTNLLSEHGDFDSYVSYWTYLTQTESTYVEWVIELEGWLKENTQSGDVVLGDTHIQRFLPVIAGEVYPIIFRPNINQSTMPMSEYNQRSNDHEAMIDALAEGNKADFVRYIENYSVDWIILNINDLLYEETEATLDMADPVEISLAQRIDDLFVYKVDRP